MRRSTRSFAENLQQMIQARSGRAAGHCETDDVIAGAAPSPRIHAETAAHSVSYVTLSPPIENVNATSDRHEATVSREFGEGGSPCFTRPSRSDRPARPDRACIICWRFSAKNACFGALSAIRREDFSRENSSNAQKCSERRFSLSAASTSSGTSGDARSQPYETPRYRDRVRHLEHRLSVFGLFGIIATIALFSAGANSNNPVRLISCAENPGFAACGMKISIPLGILAAFGCSRRASAS